MDVARLLPLLLTLAGAGVVVRGGEKAFTQIVDTVQTVLARSELQQIAGLIEADHVLGNRPPGNDAALSAYIRASMRARSGRDAALDAWGAPYRLGRDGRARIILSWGPNGRRDGCATAAARDAAGSAAAAAAADDDDICVELTLSRPAGERDGVDPHLGADSPFRRLPQGP